MKVPTTLTSFAARLAFVTIAGGLLRCSLLASGSLRVDEDFTAVVVARPIDEMLRNVARDSAPPGFYLLEHLLAQVADEPWALRLLPVIGGTALIALVGMLGRRVAGDRAGLWAAAVVAVLPTTVLASETARMYAPAGALVAAATLALWRAMERPGLRRWAAYAVLSAGAVWTSYFAAVAIAGVAGALPVLRLARPRLLAAWVSTAAALASIVPWLAAAPAQLAHANEPFWVPPLDASTVGGALVHFTTGPRVDPSVPGWPALVALQGISIVVGVGLLVVVASRTERLTPPQRAAAAFCATAALLGVALLGIMSLWRPMIDGRYMTLMWPPIYALTGVGLASLRPRVAAGLLAVGLAIPGLALSLAPTQPETIRLVAPFEDRLGPSDLVIATPSQYLFLLAQGGPSIRSRLHVLSSAEPPWFYGTAAYPEGAVIAALPPEVVENRGRVIAVTGSADPGPDLPLTYRQTEMACGIQVCVRVYEPGG